MSTLGPAIDGFFRRVFEEIPGFVSVQDRDFRIIASNAAFRREYGDPDRGFCYEVYKGGIEVCPECAVERSFSDGQVHTGQEIVRRRDGTEIRVIVYTAPIRGPGGEVEAVVELSTDITRVKELQNKYRMLFDEAPCYVSVQDRDLRITEANRRFRSDFGDEISQPCFHVYKHRTEPCPVCPVAKTFADGEVHESEEVVTTRDGKPINVLCRTAPIRNAVGEIDSVMEMSTNITELRAVQDQLTSLGMLVGSVSHGIKGLLSGLDGGLYMMDTGSSKGLPERVEQGREMLRRNVDRMRSMVLNVLYYAKGREVFWQDNDLEDLIESVAEVLALRAETVGVSLETHVEPGSFEADHNAVHSAVVNLAENAIDACRVDRSKTDHVVSLTGRVEGDEAVLEVADNGIGMDRETREKAFSLFFSSKGTEGTGLGLFVAHKIVSAHGGTIRIESEPGRGTTFEVRLPVARQIDEAAEATPESTDHGPTGYDGT